MATVSAACAAPGAAPPAVPAGERGATKIADRVVAKIAAQAAREALRDASAVRTDAHASVSVRRREGHQDFGEARVRVAVELGYPSDIGAQCGAVRRQVTQRVRELAGMSVPEVAVQIERLHAPQLERSGRGRVR
ncbi:Asp23/Gls24 family envelope stress response protein [Streptomyces rimosus]|uniref:Asp23/Gls24 family envelope stress response protein n=1 Tax=Streptomyces rimosus TaxID=1927 RepID=UPI0004C58B6C|nr:Asp23/Gls24 family envelope stress response protein [Streptomyces rimosus]